MRVMSRYFLCAFMPLAVLLILASISTLLSSIILQIFGDILPLAKLISKGTLVLLLLSIYPCMLLFKLNKHDIGFSNWNVFFKQLGIGIGLGLLTLIPVIAILYALDVKTLDQSRAVGIGVVLKKFSLSLLIAMVISSAEEPLFRGVLFSTLKARIALFAAMLISSLYYAGLHFLKSKTDVPYTDIHWDTGFSLMLEAFSNWLNPEIFPAFIALVMVGLFLAVIRTQIPNSLALCIGCHTGWVWVIKMSKYYFDTNRGSDYIYLVSSYDGVIGYLVAAWLGLVLLVYYFWQKRRHI